MRFGGARAVARPRRHGPPRRSGPVVGAADPRVAHHRRRGRRGRGWDHGRGRPAGGADGGPNSAGRLSQMRVLVAMSGGVDSSVAAARLLAEGHDVTGVTLKLWGGESDSGCCSVSDVEDARRVAAQLGIPHYTFNFTDDFDASVVSPYVEAHSAGLTPNPCVECNRSIKFGRLLERAVATGFDAVATGHHARVVGDTLARGRDRAKDQSYVLYMLTRFELVRLRLPVGEMTKAEGRA